MRGVLTTSLLIVFGLLLKGGCGLDTVLVCRSFHCPLAKRGGLREADGVIIMRACEPLFSL
jgi:hypothetical protein